jgi:hypothetical protein
MIGCLVSFVVTIGAPAVPAGGPAQGQSFYVSKAGSNANGKSWATAWSELDQINWTSAQPGDTIFLDGGTTRMVYTTILTAGTNGTETAPILIQRATEAGHDSRSAIR